MLECFPHSPETVKILRLLRRKNCRIKNLQCAHRMQFWQRYRKIFAESPKKLCPKTKNKGTFQGIYFQKQTLPKIPLRHLKTVLTTQQEYFRQKSGMFSSNFENNWKIWRFREKRNLFLQKCPLDTKKTVLTTMSKKFYKIPNILPQSPLVGVNFLKEIDNVMQEDPLNGCRKIFFKQGGTLYDRCPQSFSSKLEKIVKVNNFFRKQTFLKKFVVQTDCAFDNFFKVFAPMLKNVLFTVGKQWRNSKNS